MRINWALTQIQLEAAPLIDVSTAIELVSGEVYSNRTSLFGGEYLKKPWGKLC